MRCLPGIKVSGKTYCEAHHAPQALSGSLLTGIGPYSRAKPRRQTGFLLTCDGWNANVYAAILQHVRVFSTSRASSMSIASLRMSYAYKSYRHLKLSCSWQTVRVYRPRVRSRTLGLPGQVLLEEQLQRDRYKRAKCLCQARIAIIDILQQGKLHVRLASSRSI